MQEEYEKERDITVIILIFPIDHALAGMFKPVSFLTFFQSAVILILLLNKGQVDIRSSTLFQRVKYVGKHRPLTFFAHTKSDLQWYYIEPIVHDYSD